MLITIGNGIYIYHEREEVKVRPRTRRNPSRCRRRPAHWGHIELAFRVNNGTTLSISEELHVDAKTSGHLLIKKLRAVVDYAEAQIGQQRIIEPSELRAEAQAEVTRVLLLVLLFACGLSPMAWMLEPDLLFT